MGFLDWFRRDDAFVRVPDGFLVKTWPGELDAPSFTYLDGGVLLASTGPGGDMNVEVLRALFDAVEKALLRPHAPVRLAAKRGPLSSMLRTEEPELALIDSVVAWTLQDGILDGWSETTLLLQELLRRFHRVGSERRSVERTVQVILVRKSFLDDASWMLRLIRGLRIDVRELVPDGTAVVEVQRPDGAIVSALAGAPALEEVVGFEPSLRNAKRDLAEARGDRAALERLDEEERRELERIIRSRPLKRPRPLVHALLLRSLIVQSAGGDVGSREKLHRYLLERTTPLLIPTLRMSGGLAQSALEAVGGERAIAAFPDVLSARQLAPSEGEGQLAMMPPIEVLDIARGANLVLVLKVPGKDGPVSAIVRTAEIDAHASGQGRPN